MNRVNFRVKLLADFRTRSWLRTHARAHIRAYVIAAFVAFGGRRAVAPPPANGAASRDKNERSSWRARIASLFAAREAEEDCAKLIAIQVLRSGDS